MAHDATDNLRYFLLLETSDRPFLGSIRHWSNLKAGSDEQGIWVKDLDYAQVQSLAVKTMPRKKVFYEKQGRLFPLGSLLPKGVVPSLIWTPIDRALPVSLPSLNHNFFGIDDSLTIQLVPAKSEQQSTAMRVDLDLLENYLKTAPAVRLKNLSWCVLDDYTAFIVGTPLLPIEGAVFWQTGSFMLPSGFEFELHSLTDRLAKLFETDVQNYTIVWLEDSRYLSIPHSDLQPLTRASFRLTFQTIAL